MNEYSKPSSLKPYTVIAVHPDNGQIVADHILARNGAGAFAEMAAKHEYSSVEFVVAILGHHTELHGIDFPGETIVGAETVREQTEVFGKPAGPCPKEI